MWIARSALKSWIDGPEVTPSSGGWPERAPHQTASQPSPQPAPTEAATTQGAATQRAATPSAITPGAAPAPATAAPAAPAAKKSSTGNSAGARKKASKRLPASGNWVVPNGTAEVLQTHPVKVKLASRVYRVPGMPMYDRTVADVCYATVEDAEADGFNRAAR
jgi:large subunit ribosomal protein L17